MRNLKDRQEYIDLYDKHTIEQCRRMEFAITPEYIAKKDKTKHAKEQYERMASAWNELHLWFVMGERYKRKDETVSEWIEKDRKKDAIYDEAIAPEVSCLTCGLSLIETFKQLEWDYEHDTGKVLFMYDCKNACLPRRAFYNNGKEWVSKPRLCKKCGGDTSHSVKKTKSKIVWTDLCSKCGHETSDTWDLNEKEKEPIPDQNFEKDRARFCDPEKGGKYVEWTRNAEELSKVMEKIKEREEKKDVYDKVSALKKLSIPSVKDFLTTALEKSEYRNLVFKEPDLSRIVSVEFSVEDPTESKEYDSRINLKKLVSKVLEATNWRLMSEGISYRLGILGGRIRVYEDDHELAKLLEKGPN